MHFSSLLLLGIQTCSTALAAAIAPRQNPEYVGYLVSVFTDADPKVFQYLSNGNNALSYTKLNAGQPILASTVGTQAVRDVYIVPSGDRSKWFLIATDLDIRIPGFSWDYAVRQGSRSLVIWESTDLTNWGESRLIPVEDSTAGMVWAPSAVWDVASHQYFVFWASRFYESTDPDHKGAGTPNRIRYSTTTDFMTFSTPRDYISIADTSVIDQEFQPLDEPGHFLRYIKNETLAQIYQESSTTGLFGQWTRVPGYVTPSGPFEGAASFRDNIDRSKFYLLLDDYSQYVPFQTDDVGSGKFTRAPTDGFPPGLKHGSVTPLRQAEYDAVAAKYLR